MHEGNIIFQCHARIQKRVTRALIELLGMYMCVLGGGGTRVIELLGMYVCVLGGGGTRVLAQDSFI